MPKTQDIWIVTPGQSDVSIMDDDVGRALVTFLRKLLLATRCDTHVNVRRFEDGGFNVSINGE